uniref:Uncharacterized protein n=1 Tax=Acrobeloides nanus TaxID=290746 RepID=A0A914ELD5_9BILA
MDPNLDGAILHPEMMKEVFETALSFTKDLRLGLVNKLGYVEAQKAKAIFNFWDDNNVIVNKKYWMQNSWVLKDIIDDENSEEMEFPEELRFNKRSYERYYDTSSADEFVEFIQLLPPRQIPLSGQNVLTYLNYTDILGLPCGKDAVINVLKDEIKDKNRHIEFEDIANKAVLCHFDRLDGKCELFKEWLGYFLETTEFEPFYKYELWYKSHIYVGERLTYEWFSERKDFFKIATNIAKEMELDELMTQHHSLLDEIETFQYGEEHKAILGPLLDRINEFIESMDDEKWEEMPEKKKKELNKLLGERNVLRKVTQAKNGFEKFRETMIDYYMGGPEKRRFRKETEKWLTKQWVQVRFPSKSQKNCVVKISVPTMMQYLQLSLY